MSEYSRYNIINIRKFISRVIFLGFMQNRIEMCIGNWGKREGKYD